MITVLLGAGVATTVVLSVMAADRYLGAVPDPAATTVREVPMPLFGRKHRLFLGDAGVETVCAAAGLPSELLDDGTIIQYVLPACAAVFSDGDLVVSHRVAPRAELREWFGQERVIDGRFFTGLTQVYENPTSAVQGPLDDLQRSVAALFARGVVFADAPLELRGPLPLSGLKSTVPPLARVDGAELVFGGNFGQGEYRERLDRPVHYLLAVEPGVRLMHVIDQQIRLLTRPAFSYNYMCVTSQPFAAQFLANYLLLHARQVSGNSQLSREMIDRGFVIPAEGDIATSLRRFVDRDREIGETHGRVDLAFFVGVRTPRLTAEQARHILTDVHFLLRPGGALLLGFPAGPDAPHHLSAAELNLIANLAGFAGDYSRVHIGTSNLANQALPVYSFLRKA